MPQEKHPAPPQYSTSCQQPAASDICTSTLTERNCDGVPDHCVFLISSVRFIIVTNLIASRLFASLRGC
ncbi:hypothetical protein GBF38_019022 [Nibea albiflora]|uniref:Uncharacterized protein n=1 Tax=Nibea albiflora TaxID=240163 RepID=A0ACB7F5U1_NIBAL|nr:hypothetical protein GBF38_019022 [Nibea albiflora]